MGWEQTRDRLKQMVADDPRWVDIRAALERDRQYELLRAAVNDSGACTDDEHGDKCACNADVMPTNLQAKMAALRQRVEHLEARVAGEHFESVGWQKRAEAAEKRVEELERILGEILADHDERVELYGFDVQPNRLRVMDLARAALAAERGE